MRITMVALFFIVLAPLQAMACPDWLGYAVLRAAWMTPDYRKCTYSIEDERSGSRTLRVQAFGESAISMLDDKEVWVEAVVVLSPSNDITDIRWGKYKAFFKPGQSWEIIIQALSEHQRNY